MDLPPSLEPIDGFPGLPIERIVEPVVLLLAAGVVLWLMFRRYSR